MTWRHAWVFVFCGVCVFSVWKTGDSLKKGAFWSEELIFSYFYLLLSLGPFPLAEEFGAVSVVSVCLRA